jgi:transposase
MKTGELEERRLTHRQEAEQFYRALHEQSEKVRVGMEASGHACWFRLLAELNIELWMGDAAKIQAKRVRKKKTDREDARHILELMLKDDFPKIWFQVGTIAICGSSCGIATAWCRCALGS